jgi:hypothetical protein
MLNFSYSALEIASAKKLLTVNFTGIPAVAGRTPVFPTQELEDLGCRHCQLAGTTFLFCLQLLLQ